MTWRAGFGSPASFFLSQGVCMSDPKRFVPVARPLDRDFGVAQYKRNEWRLELDAHFKFDDVMVPQFWANQVDKVRGHNKQGGRGDILEIWQPSTESYGKFLIVAIGDGYLKLRPIEAIKAPDVSVPADSPLVTRWNVGKRGHEVIRSDDGVVMAGPFQIKGDAVSWIEDHLKKMAA